MQHSKQRFQQFQIFKLALEEESIYFEIENNFDPKEMSSSTGIGLKNLRKRLSLLYPKKHDLVIDKTLNTYKTTLKILKHA